MRLGSTMKLAVAALLLVLSGTSDLLAQKSTETRGTMVLTEGRRYLVGFPQVQASATEKPMPQPMQLFISSKSKGKVRVQTPAAINDAARIDKEYNVEPNKVLRIPIPIGYMNQESESRKGYAFWLHRRSRFLSRHIRHGWVMVSWLATFQLKVGARITTR